MKPEMPSSVPVAIFLPSRVSLGFALLAGAIFERANLLSGRAAFALSYVSHKPGRRVFRHGFGLARATTRPPSGGYLLVPPLDLLGADFAASGGETEFLRQANARGATLASACLGSLLIASTGLLDGRRATTHWQWAERAAKLFPGVRWATRELLCEDTGFITAGGLLAVVDLSLHIVSRHCPKPLCRELGRTLLADTVRQRQSAYAGTLVPAPRHAEPFETLTSELRNRLNHPPSVPEMASHCRMSLRSFHRAFAECYGVGPGKYVQLLRIERARELLADRRFSIEDIAVRCGFSQTAFFRSIFSRETGLTPAQFRKRL